MSRGKDAPIGFECPYRHNCPHLEGMSTTWMLDVHQEVFDLRNQLHAMEQKYEQRIAELQKTLLERDEKIAQLQLDHRKKFKAKVKRPAVHGKARRRGAPLGHPGWHRREPDHIDQVVHVSAPATCPHCQHDALLPCAELHEHVQEDIVLIPRTRVTKFVHEQCWCPHCRREVHQAAPGELPGCDIGPVTRAVAAYMRYDLQITYRKVQDILSNLFGMPMVHATAMNFDRKATAVGKPIFEQLQILLQSAGVAYADETTWREDGVGHYIWFGGNKDVAVYQITDSRAQENAVQLLGNQFDGVLVTDDYAGYNAVHAKHQQTCWNHLRTRAKEIEQQIELAGAQARAPRSIKFCQELQRFALRLCDLGQKLKKGKLSRAKARKMIPLLQRQLRRFASQPLEFEAAETLRLRVMEKDWDKLFTFLRVKDVEPTNNHAERSLRFLVIMRKICFGTRSPEGSESHGVLASILQTAKLHGKNAIQFMVKLLTEPTEKATAALFASGP
jgi:transposase